MGVTTFFRLMAEHGDAAAALAALPGLARASGAEEYTPWSAAAAEAEVAAGRALGARLLPFGAPGYPALLALIPDPPPLLWALGDGDVLTKPAVALVGARNASSLGLRMTRALVKGLGSAGMTIVSGLARGIDAAAHETALATGTVAVQAGGIDVLYPAENAALAGRIAEQGLRLSEQPVGLEPQARHFPRRNRIVAGLSRAVVVVEAAAKSGSLITARIALEQGREVLAVPGHPFDARASGCNMLIRDGAALVRGHEDVLAALEAAPGLDWAPWATAAAEGSAGSTRTSPRKVDPAPRGLEGSSVPRQRDASPGPGSARHDAAPGTDAGPAPDLAHAILTLLGPAPVPEDQVLRDLGLPPQALAAELLSLELDGRIERRAGGMLALSA